MEKMQEIWIVEESGKPLFNSCVESTVDPALFGGFLSAIQQFVQTSFSGSKIDKLFLGESKLSFLYVKDYHLFFVVRCHKKVKDKEIANNLEKIHDLFVSTYKDKLNKGKIESSDFQSFKNLLEENLKEAKLKTRMKTWLDEI